MRLRLVTYNIHKGIGGLDRRYALERIRDVLARLDADVVCLQEVDADTRRARGDWQVDRLGEWLGYRHRVYVPHVPVRGGGHYGNALLSRFPVAAADWIDLTVRPWKRRSALHARLRVRRSGRDRRAHTVHVVTLHLGLTGRVRRRQLSRFLDSRPFAGLHPRAPLVVAGDLNDVWGTLGGRVLGPAGFRGPARTPRTFPAWAPVRALDGVYVAGDARLLAVRTETAAPARRASDHLPLVVEVELR